LFGRLTNNPANIFFSQLTFSFRDSYISLINPAFINEIECCSIKVKNKNVGQATNINENDEPTTT